MSFRKLLCLLLTFCLTVGIMTETMQVYAIEDVEMIEEETEEEEAVIEEIVDESHEPEDAEDPEDPGDPGDPEDPDDPSEPEEPEDPIEKIYDIEQAEITLSKTVFTYNGEACTPTPTVVLNEETLVQDTDYVVEYFNNVEPGSAMIIVTGAGEYYGEQILEFEIQKKSQVISVTTSYTKTYGDAAFNLNATTNGEGELTYKSSDTGIAVVSAAGKVTIKKAGTVQITVSAAETDHYKEAASKTVTIKIAKAKQTVTVTSSYSKTYGDKAFTVKASSDGDGTLTFKSSDTKIATVSGAGKVTIKSAGTVKITVAAKATDRYQAAASKTITIKIAKATQKVTVTSKYSKTMNSSAFTVKASTNGDGQLKYKSSNTKIATVSSKGKVTVKGIGVAKITVYAAASTNYKKSASKTITITITPAKGAVTKASNSAKNQATVTWKSLKGVAGYQVQYSVLKDYSKAKTVKVTSASTVSKVLKDLTKGYKYYFRVRGYKKVSSKTYYGEWSANKTLTISKGNEEVFDKVPKNPEIDVEDIDAFTVIGTWKKVSGASGYEVSIKKGKNGTYKVLGTTTKTSYVTTISHGAYYYMRIRAYKEKDDGSQIFGDYVYTDGQMIYYSPNYSVFMSEKTDSSCSSVFMNITNNGVGTMRVYSKNARLIDYDYTSFNRDLQMISIPDLENGKLKKISYVDIPKGKSVWVGFIVDGSDTWYDKKTKIRYDFRYDGNDYYAYSSNYYGTNYYRY